MQRTFPNVLTTEAVMGSEYAKRGARVTPEHNVMLAFTRLLAGPLDYAPGAFTNVSREQFQPREQRPMALGTRAHQLALYVVFESALQMVADAPEAYKNERDFDFIKAVPATWEETRALGGEVGQYVAIARKQRNEWFLGAITNWTARDLDVPLAFLGPGNFTADIYADGQASETRPVTAATALHLKLASGGGVAIRFRPAN